LSDSRQRQKAIRTLEKIADMPGQSGWDTTYLEFDDGVVSAGGKATGGVTISPGWELVAGASMLGAGEAAGVGAFL